ncbi:MAG: type II toxin-antitoxin system HigB family toxin [Candidatus Brocadiales bacterium]|nr:type II toxin-antitoxin system HigB family toxin [Candidatus Brocadiales bacterium]
MRIISRKTLKNYSEENPEVKSHLDAWYWEVKHANWNSPADVKKSHPKSRNVGKDIVIFNILRNRFRLIIRVNYETGEEISK